MRRFNSDLTEIYSANHRNIISNHDEEGKSDPGKSLQRTRSSSELINEGLILNQVDYDDYEKLKIQELKQNNSALKAKERLEVNDAENEDAAALGLSLLENFQKFISMTVNENNKMTKTSYSEKQVNEIAERINQATKVQLAKIETQISSVKNVTLENNSIRVQERNNFEARLQNLESFLAEVKSELDNTRNEYKKKEKEFRKNEERLKQLESENESLKKESIASKKILQQLHNQVQTHHSMQTPNHQASSGNKEIQVLAKDLEEVMLRVAALGEERIQHIEIVGNGQRTAEGLQVRKMVMEGQLGKEDNQHLTIPSSWSSHSDSKTINLNFKQLTAMFNDVIIKRLEQLENGFESKVKPLERKVDILQRLFNHMKTSSQDEELKGQKLEADPKINLQPGASAGRAAFNRANKLKLQ